MYNQTQIRAYNDHRDSYDAVWAVVKHFRIQPIGFEAHLIADDGDKCAIHTPVFTDDTGVGCGDVAIGDHASIKSLYVKDGPSWCHAELGARNLDCEFAAKVARLDSEFVQVALRCSKRFVSRYMNGGSVLWTRYGRGYCYLQLIYPTARHRVARILGPFPLVSDVMRFVIVAGNWGYDGFFFERMSGGLLHVAARNWSPGTSLRSILKHSVTIGSTDRVGGNAFSMVGNPIRGYAELFREAGYAHALPAFEDVKGFLATVPRSRCEAVRSWMLAHKMVVDETILACMLLATSALLALNVPGVAAIKKKIRMWQVLGDLVCKHYAAMHVLSGDGTAEEYSHLVGKGRQCNQAMAAAAVTSDLLGVCAADHLSLHSKAWADILEGVIGVVAMTQSAVVLRHCLIHFGLIPSSAVEQPPLAALPPEDGSVLLNSGEWRRAMELVIKGKL